MGHRSTYPLLKTHGRHVASHTGVLFMTAPKWVVVHGEATLGDGLLEACASHLIQVDRAHSWRGVHTPLVSSLTLLRPSLINQRNDLHLVTWIPRHLSLYHEIWHIGDSWWIIIMNKITPQARNWGQMPNPTNSIRMMGECDKHDTAGNDTLFTISSRL